MPWSRWNRTPQKTVNYTHYFYDSNTFRSMYWVIQHWEYYVVPCCHWATLSPVAITSGCFLHQPSQNLRHLRRFCWCHTVYQTYLCCDCNPSRLYSGCVTSTSCCLLWDWTAFLSNDSTGHFVKHLKSHFPDCLTVQIMVVCCQKGGGSTTKTMAQSLLRLSNKKRRFGEVPFTGPCRGPPFYACNCCKP